MRGYVRGCLLLALLLLAGCESGGQAESPTEPAATQPQAQPTGTSASATARLADTATPADPAVPASRPLPITRAPELPVLYQVEGMEQVTVAKDLPYNPTGQAEYMLDIYYPPGTDPRNRDQDPELEDKHLPEVGQRGDLQPAVILVHGSLEAWQGGKNYAPFASWGRVVAASGIAAVTFNWNFPRHEEIGMLLDYLRKDAVRLGLDPERLALLAFSGGGASAFKVALEEQSPPLRALAIYYGDLREPAVLLTPEAVGLLPPTLIVVGGEDEVLPGAEKRFLEQARRLDAPVEELLHPTGAHAFDLRNDDDTTRSIIRQTLEFLRARLG